MGGFKGGDSRWLKNKDFAHMIHTPQSMFVYAMALVNALVRERQLDALSVEIGMNITRIKRGVLSVDMKKSIIYVPVGEKETADEIYNKYKSIIENVLVSLSNDLKNVHDLFAKAQDVGVSETELNSLDYVFGDLYDEVVSFMRKIDKFNYTQRADLASKYLSIAFQRLTARAVQRLAEMGAVLQDVSTLTSVRLLWFPNTSRGVYNIPSSKIQVLNLLKQLLSGLIDYSTDENEYTRLARLALKLNDDFDIDTLIGLIMKLYLDPNDADLPRWLEERGLPKKYVPLALLSYAIIKKRCVYAFIDFEGITPIVVVYPKTPITEICTEVVVNEV